MKAFYVGLIGRSRQWDLLVSVADSANGEKESKRNKKMQSTYPERCQVGYSARGKSIMD